jgi:hypothetical protein
VPVRSEVLDLLVDLVQSGRTPTPEEDAITASATGAEHILAGRIIAAPADDLRKTLFGRLAQGDPERAAREIWPGEPHDA